jgi:hypothetical protein
MKTDTKELASELRQYNLGGIFDEAADRLEQHGKPTDAADPNGSAYARLKWWKDRADDLHDQLAAKDAHADEIYKAAVGLAAKLEADLAAERSLADRLAETLANVQGDYASTGAIVPSEVDTAITAWKEARRE